MAMIFVVKFVTVVDFTLSLYSECCVLILGDAPASEFCVDVSKHCFIFIGGVLKPPMKMEVPRNVCT